MSMIQLKNNLSGNGGPILRKKTIKENQYWDTNPDDEISKRGFQSIVKSEKEDMLVRNKNIENFRGKNPKQKINQTEI